MGIFRTQNVHRLRFHPCISNNPLDDIVDVQNQHYADLKAADEQAPFNNNLFPKSTTERKTVTPEKFSRIMEYYAMSTKRSLVRMNTFNQ